MINDTLRTIMLLLFFSSTAFGAPVPDRKVEQALPEKMIPVAQLREDLRVMKGALEESHVGLHWFISKPQLDRRFESISAALTRPMTDREFHRRLLPIVAAVRHGHTTLSLPTQGVSYRMKHLSKTRKYLPFRVRILRNKLYVVSDLSEKADIGAGTQIIAINGRPAKNLIGEMRRYLSVDGANDTFKLFQLGEYYQFHFLLDLIYGASDTYTLDIIPNANNTKVRRSVPALSPQEMKDYYRERTGRDIDEFPPALRLQMLSGRTALLRIGSFYEGLFGPEHPDFSVFLASAFKSIRENKVEDLIIDVRSNEGGNNSYVPLLYSYLADKPFRLIKPTVLASKSMSFFKYVENPSDDVKAFAVDPLRFVSPGADGSWVLKQEFDTDKYRVFEPQPDRFTGRLYVLTDGGSFSATNDFVDLVYRYHRVEKRSVNFIGEQNGGDNSSGRVSGGQMMSIVLPHSRQKLGIPLLGSSQHFALVVPKANIPDHRVSPSIQDVIGGVDRELLFAQELIARQQKP